MPQPMTIGLIGPGETPLATAISLLEDLTEVADPIKFIVAADPANWTTTTAGIVEFLAENDVSFELVVSDESDLDAELTEAAQATHKVARPMVKVVSLLEKADGEKRLVVLWDDEDEALVKATERAIDRGIEALDLTAGLEPLEFSDDDDDAAADDDEAAADTAAEATAPVVEDDGLDKLGVRALRNKVEEELGLSRKVVGSMDKAACIEALRGAEGIEPEPAPEPQTELVEVPAARLDDTVETVDDDDEPLQALARAEDVRHAELAGLAVAKSVNDTWARETALQRAVAFHSPDTDVDTVVRTAHRFKSFLTGEQVVAGRPRKDGSPAQPRVRSA